MNKNLFFGIICLVIVSCGEKSNSGFKGGDETEIKKKIILFIQSSDYRSAIDLLNITIQENPDKAYLYNCRAECYEKLYNKDTLQKIYLNNALSDITKSILLEPTSERYISRAGIKFSLKRKEEAINDYDLSINIKDGNQARSLMQRAEFYFMQMKDSSKAFSDFRDAIKVCTDNEVCRIYLSFAQKLQSAGKYDEALENYLFCFKKFRTFEFKDVFEKLEILVGLYHGLCESFIEIGDYLGVVTISLENDFIWNYNSEYNLYSKYKLGQEEYSRKEMKRKGYNQKLSGQNRSKYFFEMFPNEPKTSSEEAQFEREKIKWPNI